MRSIAGPMVDKAIPTTMSPQDIIDRLNEYEERVVTLTERSARQAERICDLADVEITLEDIREGHCNVIDVLQQRLDTQAETIESLKQHLHKARTLDMSDKQSGVDTSNTEWVGCFTRLAERVHALEQAGEPEEPDKYKQFYEDMVKLYEEAHRYSEFYQNARSMILKLKVL